MQIDDQVSETSGESYRAAIALEFTKHFADLLRGNVVTPDGDTGEIGRELTPKEEAAYGSALNFLEMYFDQPINKSPPNTPVAATA